MVQASSQTFSIYWAEVDAELSHVEYAPFHSVMMLLIERRFGDLVAVAWVTPWNAYMTFPDERVRAKTEHDKKHLSVESPNGHWQENLWLLKRHIDYVCNDSV